MGMMQEFKQFAMRGNVMDMAVGVIIGGAFSKIVSSLVNDVMMPPIGKLMGNIDLSGLFIQLGGVDKYASLAKARDAGVATVNYGLFINTVVDFVIVAFVTFMMIKGMNTLHNIESAKPAPVCEPPADIKLLTEIRDLMKNK
ncbi:MAG: large conductance mechanosensitive channel protein MscL [bacterium]